MSVLLMVGGASIALLLLAALQLGDLRSTFLLFALGSFLGGFQAARMSPGVTVLEPALAAAITALFASLLDPMLDMGIYAASFEQVTAPPTVGLVAFAAGYAGARLGERVPSLATSQSRLDWSVPCLFTLVGALLSCGLVAGLVGLLDPGWGEGAMLVAVFAAPVLAGVVTQLAAPIPVGLPFFLAGAWFGVLVLAIILPSGKFDVLFISFLVCGSTSVLYGVLALLGARFAARRKASWGDPLGPRATDPLPQARTRD